MAKEEHHYTVSFTGMNNPAATVARSEYEREFEKIKRGNERLVEAVLNGVPGEALKKKGEYIVRRKAELEEILETTEEAPVLFQSKHGATISRGGFQPHRSVEQ